MFITHQKAFRSCTSLALFLCASLGTAFLFAGEDWQPQVIGPFGTLNNRDTSFAIPSENAQDLLNVNITQGGKSVFKRKGYATAFTLPITTSPVHGVYNFFDSQGNDVSLFFNDTYMSGSVNGTGPNTIFSDGPNGATYQCTDNLGFAYCVNSARASLTKTNGVTSSSINGIISTGTTVATCVTRLAMGGFSDRPSAIDFSADSDFTTWGTGSLGSSAVQLTVSAPGSRITHLVYAFGRLIWFKDSSFGYVIVGNQPLQTDWVIRTISFDVGTNDNTSVFREGILYFHGQDGHIYAFDGSNYQRLSKEISGTVNTSQSRIGGSWTQTTQADFQNGSTVIPGWLSTATFSGSIVLSSQSASSPFVDTNASDFNSASSITNLDTTTVPGSIYLSTFTGPVFAAYQQYGADNSDLGTNSGGSCPFEVSQSFTVGSTPLIFSSVTVRLRNTTSGADARFYLYSDSSGSPGSQIGVGLNDVPTSIGTSYVDVNVNFSQIILTANTRYWLRMTSSANPFGSNISIVWAGTNGSFSEISKHNTTCSDTAKNAKYKIYGATVSYNSSGSLVSRTFDMGVTTDTWIWGWKNFYSSGSIPSGSTVTYQTQVSSSATGIFDSLVSVTTGSLITSQVKEFIRYKATFNSIPSTSPVITDVQIYSSAMLRPSATFYSAIKNAPSLTSWDNFSAAKEDNGGSHRFSIRSSTNTFSVLSSTPSWGTANSGATISISTGSYFQIADYISVSSYGALTSSYGPKLDSFTQNWFEGIASDKSYATYFDNKIWWEVTGGTGSIINNLTLVYDLLNQGWTLYDLGSNGFYIRQAKLYFGSSTGGYIYKFGDVDNDNGSAIRSYWKSKDFFGADPFTNEELTNISIAAKSVANSTVTLTYAINSSSSVAFSFPLYSAGNLLINKNRNIPAGTIANTFNVQFGNNAADQPFEVFAVQVGIRPKTWIPTP